MTNNINRIGINAGNVNTNYTNPKPQEEAKTEEKQQGAQTQTRSADVKPDDVLNYMAQAAVVNAPRVNTPKTYDVSKYVTPEQAERIAGFINGFEDAVAEGLIAINAELGDLDISDAAKYEIAAGMAEVQA